MAANDNNNLQEHKNNINNNKYSNKETKPKTNIKVIEEQQTAKKEETMR